MTIRSVAQALGYASPLLYEHFRDKEDLLTQIAMDTLGQLEAKLTEKMPTDRRVAVERMVERYRTFMLEHTQLYRLVNGMDGMPVDKTVVSRSAQSLCKAVAGQYGLCSERMQEKPMGKSSLMSCGLCCMGCRRFLWIEPRCSI